MQKPPAAAHPLKSAIIQRVVSTRGPLNRLKARRFGLDLLLRRRPQLELYYEAGDPTSHLCARQLAVLLPRLQVPVKIRLVGQSIAALYPEAEAQRRYALRDAQLTAPAFGLNLPTDACLPDAEVRLLAARALAPACTADDFLRREQSLALALFHNDREALREAAETAGCAMVPNTHLLLKANALRREYLGHYLPGMWQFNGDWFWGLDRLGHLETALRQQDGLQGEAPLAECVPGQAELTDIPPGPLEFFYSFRSPYSYLAVETLSDELRQADLQVRPVLPMAMRGLAVPRAKRLYISRDVKREADRLGLPFGYIADPLGDGALRCLSVFPLAQGLDQQLEFLRQAGRAVWTQGIDVATDAGLRHVCNAAGIDWSVAAAQLADAPDLDYAEQNRQALLAAGLWGVPSFRIGSFATWGRDRMWLVSELLRRRAA